MTRYRRRTRLPARFLILCVVLETLFISFASIAEAQEEDRFDFIINTSTQHVGTAVYERELDGGGVWLDGDRIAYSRIYAFLDCNPDNTTLNMRVAAFAYTTAVKATIFDKFMAEGTRRWDGTIEPDGEIPARDSDAPRLASHGAGWPTSTPVINVVGPSGDVCEVRDYGNVVEGTGVTFAVISESSTQVIVGWFVDGAPAVEFYYEILDGVYRLDVE